MQNNRLTNNLNPTLIFFIITDILHYHAIKKYISIIPTILGFEPNPKGHSPSVVGQRA